MSHNITVLIEPSLREQLFTGDQLARLNSLGSVTEYSGDERRGDRHQLLAKPGL